MSSETGDWTQFNDPINCARLKAEWNKVIVKDPILMSIKRLQ